MKTIYLIFIYIPSTEDTQGVYTLLKFRDTGKRVNEDKTPALSRLSFLRGTSGGLGWEAPPHSPPTHQEVYTVDLQSLLVMGITAL